MAVNPAPANFPYTAFSCGSAKDANLGAKRPADVKPGVLHAERTTAPLRLAGGRGEGGPPGY